MPTDSQTSPQTLSERINRFRQKGDFEAAHVIAQQYVFMYPDDAEGYWLEALCRYGVKTAESEGNLVNRAREVDFSACDEYLKACSLATPEQRQSFEEQAADIDAAHKEFCYNYALELKKKGTFESLTQASGLLAGLGDYKDAATHAEESKSLENNAIKAVQRKDSRLPKILLCFAIIALLVTATIGLIIPGSNYFKAKDLASEGNYAEAISLMESLGKFFDAPDQALAIRAARSEASLQADTIEVGGSVWLGTYEQDDNKYNNEEDIEWIVLDIDDNKALLISKYILDAHYFNETADQGSHWEGSDLKEWLENDFASDAFSADDLQIIDGSPFCLSVDQANQYFGSNDERIAYATTYAKGHAVLCNEFWAGRWWLSDSDDIYGNGSVITPHGAVDEDGCRVYDARGGVRPAIWINVDGLKDVEVNKYVEPELKTEITPAYVLDVTFDDVPLGTVDALDAIDAKIMNFGMYLYKSNAYEKDGVPIYNFMFLNRTDNNIGSFTFYILGLDSSGKPVAFSDDMEFLDSTAAGAASLVQTYTYSYKSTYGEIVSIDIAYNSNVESFKLIAVEYESMGATLTNQAAEPWLKAAAAIDL